MRHELKTWPPFFGEVLAGEKTFEVRKNDRMFVPGDTILLREFIGPDTYTGREIEVVVTYVLLGGKFGLHKSTCVLGIVLKYVSDELTNLRARVNELEADLQRADADHVSLMRISGALVDAGDVLVEPYDLAVRELTRQRDEARNRVKELESVSFCSAHQQPCIACVGNLNAQLAQSRADVADLARALSRSHARCACPLGKCSTCVKAIEVLGRPSIEEARAAAKKSTQK